MYLGFRRDKQKNIADTLIDDDDNSNEVFEKKDKEKPNDEHQRKRKTLSEKVHIQNCTRIIGISSYKRVMSMIIFPPTNHLLELLIKES